MPQTEPLASTQEPFSLPSFPSTLLAILREGRTFYRRRRRGFEAGRRQRIRACVASRVCAESRALTPSSRGHPVWLGCVMRAYECWESFHGL